MKELTALLLAAAAALGLARATRLPAVPFLLASGLALGSLWPALHGGLDGLLLLGLTVLMFAAGIELNPGRVGSQWRPALEVGLVQFALLGLAGWALAGFFGIPAQAAVYVGMATAASSTLVVVRLLALRGELAQPTARMVLGVLLLQDLLVILLIPILAGGGQGLSGMAGGLLGTLGLVALAFFCQRQVFPRLILARQSEDEGLVMSVMAILFGFLGLTWWLGLPPVAGAFLAGFALSEFPVSGVVRGQLGSLWDFFGALFFTALGAMVDVPDLQILLKALALTALLVVLTPILVALLAERAGFSARASVEAGLLLAQTSELSLVLGLHGLGSGILDSNTFSLVALVTALTMLLTPLLTLPQVTRRLMYLHPSRRRRCHASVCRRPDEALPSQDHVVVLGCGETGGLLLEHLDPETTLAIDQDPSVVGDLCERGFQCVRGDGVDRALLERVGACRARVVVSTMARVEDNLKIIQLVAPVPVLVRVFDSAHARRLEEAGGTPILHSEAAASEVLAHLQRTRPELVQTALVLDPGRPNLGRMPAS